MEGGCIICPQFDFYKIVLLHIEEEAMFLLVLLFYLRFFLSLLQFQPIFVSFGAISAVQNHCFKAMLLVGINPNRASNWG